MPGDRSLEPDRPEASFLSHSAAWTFAGVALGALVSRRFLAIPLAVAVALVQEALRLRLLRPRRA